MERDQDIKETPTATHVETSAKFDGDTYLEDDPHRAALELNPDRPERLSWSVCLSVLFLSLAFVPSLTCGFILPAGILIQIGTKLGDTANIAWLPGSWSIASSVSFSIAGKLSDVFGRRNVILVGQALALVGLIVGATANKVDGLIVSGTLTGFGCGMLFVSYAGVPEMLPNKWRNVGLGALEVFTCIPFALCSVLIGNALLSGATWRWCYYIGIIYGGIAIVGTAIVYHPPSRPQLDFDRTRWQETKSLDYVGLLLYTAGLTIFLIGLTWAGTPAHPWMSAGVIAPIVVGGLAFVASFVYSFTVPAEAFFPLKLFKQVREFTVLLVVVFVSGMCYYSMAGLLPQATLWIFTNDPVEIGITQLPNGFANLWGGVLLPMLSHKIGYVKWQIVGALVAQTLFIALYSVPLPGSKSAWMALQFFGQGCFGWITLTTYFVASLHVPLRELGVAAGLIGTFRSAGGSVGNAIFNTILNNIVSSRLGGQIAAAATTAGFNPENLETLIPAVINNAAGVPEAFTGISGVTAEVQAATALAVKETYAYAFKRVFWSTIPFGVIAIICALFITDPSQYMTNHLAVRMEKGAPALVTKDAEKDGDVAASKKADRSVD